MFTESMIRLFAIVLERDGEKVTEALLDIGVMQSISINAFDNAAGYRDNFGPSAETIMRLSDLRKRIESFLGSAAIVPHIPQSIDAARVSRRNIDEESRRLDALAAELQQFRDRQRLLQNDILKYEEIKRQIDLYGSSFSSETLRAGFSYVSLRLGSLPSGRTTALQERLRETPSVIVPVGEKEDREHLIIIAMKRDRERIDALLSDSGWTPVELSADMHGVKNEVTGAVDEKLQALHKEQRRLQEESKAVITEKRDALLESWVRLRIDELYVKVQSTFRRSSHTLLISGWLPAARRHNVAETLRRATEGRCYIEWLSPDEVSDLHEERATAPVMLRNPRILAPFQMLVTNFGIPEYGTIDPTPFIVITYLIMFGLMFADIGQGAVITLLGILGMASLKLKRSQRALAALLVWCGGSSMLFGMLFGSFFGFSAVKPLWFDFHGIVTGQTHPSAGIASIYDILGITVKFGIVVISCGLLFNWINLIRKHRWMELVFEKGGLLGGWIYGGGIYCGWYMVTHDYRALPGVAVISVLLGVPALLLSLKGPFHSAIHRTSFSVTLLLKVVMEWVVELLEIFSGYLANTLSFMRVAGLGIAHVSLMVAFFTMAAMVRGNDPGIAASITATLLLIAGNIMVIALEGLSAGIQALRLNYYEFFTKFFHGTGKLFNPVGLREQHNL
ncbi:MAG: hypothetical protein JW913_16495 [Chitinispirillaceae bacterium]|nr:hypothetical protein [Chitinispirillaceae bacterium]